MKIQFHLIMQFIQKNPFSSSKINFLKLISKTMLNYFSNFEIHKKFLFKKANKLKKNKNEQPNVSKD